MENREIARILDETADLMEIAGEDGFRIRSYRNAASVHRRRTPKSVEDIVCNPERKVTEIPGVGKGIALALRGYLRARIVRQARSHCSKNFRLQGSSC